MANDKDFITKNPIEVGGTINVKIGTITGNNIDLATGNHFSDTLTAGKTYTISNAGDVQSFKLDITGGGHPIVDFFSTHLYTGNATARTITNNINLSGEGGLVWTKKRNDIAPNTLVDTERGTGKYLEANGTGQEQTGSNNVTGFTSTGYTIGATAGAFNDNGDTYVSWTFRKATKFFDIVTYTGNGVQGRTISHNLGSIPGVIITKKLDGADNWVLYHRSIGAGKMLYLNTENAELTSSAVYPTTPTDSVFYVGNDSAVNENTRTYVAYVFADNSSDAAGDRMISCGTYTGNNSTTGPIVDLGFEPQWLFIKHRDANGNSSFIFDNKRGVATNGNDKYLRPNSTGDEQDSADLLAFNATGFQLKRANDDVNGLNKNYVYIAIRAAADHAITWPASIEWHKGVTPTSPAKAEKDVFGFITNDGGVSYTGTKPIDNSS